MKIEDIPYNLPLLTMSHGAWAFDCGNQFAAAEATTAMDKMSDATAKGLVHTFIDDAKMLLHSGKHNYEKPAAGKEDHARDIAKANCPKCKARPRWKTSCGFH